MATQRLLVPALLGAIVLATSPPRSQDPDSERDAVKAMLTDLHRAAAEASPRYFEHIEPGAILLGTDAEERWTVEQFETLITPFFDSGEGFTTKPTEINVYLAQNGELAWFDERLQSDKWGEMRGTGVVRKADSRWRIVHYNTSFPVPNGIFRELVKRIAERPGRRPATVPAVAEGDADVKVVLDDFHRASVAADLEGTLGHLAEDAIYFGTDPAERFTVAQLRDFIAPYFAQGMGWTAIPWVQHIELSADGSVAWFDERLTSSSWGEMRGTGVLTRDGQEWKIVQFSLSLPVPNDLINDLITLRDK